MVTIWNEAKNNWSRHLTESEKVVAMLAMGQIMKITSQSSIMMNPFFKLSWIYDNSDTLTNIYEGGSHQKVLFFSGNSVVGNEDKNIIFLPSIDKLKLQIEKYNKKLQNK